MNHDMTIDELHLRLDSIFGIAELEDPVFSDAMQILREHIQMKASNLETIRLEPFENVLRAIRGLKQDADYLRLREIINNFNSRTK